MYDKARPPQLFLIEKQKKKKWQELDKYCPKLISPHLPVHFEPIAHIMSWTSLEKKIDKIMYIKAHQPIEETTSRNQTIEVHKIEIIMTMCNCCF